MMRTRDREKIEEEKKKGDKERHCSLCVLCSSSTPGCR